MLKRNFLFCLISLTCMNFVYADGLTSQIKNQNLLDWHAVTNMPPGAEVAILSGNPEKSGHFVARVKLPANYIVPAHSHDINEYDTVISGTYYLGTGTIADAKVGVALHAGDFVEVPANLKHYGYTKEPTIIEINADGPWGMIYETNG
jgi:quercetin dioxygenase-like cupin family protein